MAGWPQTGTALVESIYLYGPTTAAEMPIDEALRRAVAHGRRGNIAQAEAALNEAYRLAGANNPGTGWQWYQGTHPLQNVEG